MPVSAHLAAELAYAHRAGAPDPRLPSVERCLERVEGLNRRARRRTLDELTAEPVLQPGQPVPGCSCEPCTGIPDSGPAWSKKGRQRWSGPAEELLDLRLEDARRLSILDAARRLGLGKPRKRGREWVVCCPFHEDRDPSLRLNPEKNVWNCFPCGIGGDVIELWKRVERVDFVTAVEQMAG